MQEYGWRCRQCGKINNGYIITCSCGASIKDADDPKVPINTNKLDDKDIELLSNKSSSEQNNKSYWKCSKCGRINYDNVGTCGCGASKADGLEVDNQEVEKENLFRKLKSEDKKNNDYSAKGKKIAKILIIIEIIFFGVAFLFQEWNDKYKISNEELISCAEQAANEVTRYQYKPYFGNEKVYIRDKNKAIIGMDVYPCNAFGVYSNFSSGYVLVYVKMKKDSDTFQYHAEIYTSQEFADMNYSKFKEDYWKK